jgi:hypothetical protein
VVDAVDHIIPAERWLPAVGYENWYEVSDLGCVRRVRGGSGARLGLRVLYCNPAGYLSLCLYREGCRSYELIHRIVAKAFLGPCPPGKREINHLDGNKSNNRPENLEWVTPKEQQRHASFLGLKARGSSHGRTHLSETDVQEIRTLRGHVTGRALAARFGVHPTQISKIQLRRTWRRL